MSIGARLQFILENKPKAEDVQVLKSQGLHFNELFSFECPDIFFDKIDQEAFEAMSPFIVPCKENAIRLWDRICQLNYINEWLYRLYLLSHPDSESNFIVKNLSEAVYRKSSEVLDFFLKNKRVEVTDEMAFHWWVKLRDHSTAFKLQENKVNPNARNSEGEVPLLAVIKADRRDYFGFGFFQSNHIFSLLYAGAAEGEARALCEQLGKKDLLSAFRQFDRL
jgi:hypothetical protein